VKNIIVCIFCKKHGNEITHEGFVRREIMENIRKETIAECNKEKAAQVKRLKRKLDDEYPTWNILFKKFVDEAFGMEMQKK